MAQNMETLKHHFFCFKKRLLCKTYINKKKVYIFGIAAFVSTGSIKISHDLTPQMNTVKNKNCAK